MYIQFPRPARPTPEVKRRIGIGAIELAASAALLLGYFVLRGMRPDAVEESVDRALHLVRLQNRFGIFLEPKIQAVASDYGFVLDAATFIYAWGMFPLIAVVAVWLAFWNVQGFRFVRNVMLFSGLIGLLCYWLLPTAPPRLLEVHGYDFGFVDTVFGDTSKANYFQPGPLVNHYAALPSFHFGWVALMGGAIWMHSRRRTMRVFAVIFPALMWFSVIITANHFIFDMVFGAAVVSLSWVFVGWLHSEPVQERLGGLLRRRRFTKARATQ